MWIPVWTIRPCSYEALAGVPGEMQLWQLLHSRNADYWRPCYANREQLGATIGLSARTISRQLSALAKVGLLFEVLRGREPKTLRNRPPARWALDPLEIERWTPKVEAAIARVAEEDGQGTGWVKWALVELAKFRKRSERLAALISRDMPASKPRKRRYGRKRSVRKELHRRTSFLARGDNLAREGMGLPIPGEKIKADGPLVVEGLVTQ